MCDFVYVQLYVSIDVEFYGSGKYNNRDKSTVKQSQTAVSTYFTSKQILRLRFVEQYSKNYKTI